MEVLIVLFIASILIVAVTGAWRRYNAQNDLHLAAQRLLKELADAQTQARSFGIAQIRAGTSPPTMANATAQAPGTFLKGRLISSSPAQGLVVSSEWWIGEQQGSAVYLQMATANLPSLPYASGNSTLDQGLTLELGQSVNPSSQPTVLASIAFQPDGTILVVNSTVPTTIVLGNGISNQTISLTPLGKASLQDGP
jgi:type II secretory pathway pseudopilin PulG